jgi:endo-1,4-beta-xylanase
MRFTNPNFSKTNIKMFAVLFILVTTNLIACKSSLEEDLSPANSQQAVATDKSDLIDYVTGSIGFIKNQTLKGNFSFPIGAAVIKERLEGSVYPEVLARDFNSVTVESSLNFRAVHPEEDKWTFEKADAIVDFAESHNMRVHGSTLLYPADAMMPTWIREFQGDKDAWKKVLQTHVQTVVEHYKGRIKAWDVCNEAIKDNGELRNNIWLRNIGTEYIGLAFKYAHEADPDALLFYNDYGQEFGGAKMDKIMDLVAQAKDNGVHIDGLGFQLHTVLRITVDKIANNLARAASTGLKVYISELDVSVRYQKPNLFDLDLFLANEQGDKIKAIVEAYMDNVPKDQQYGITTWGVGDGDSFWNVRAGDDRYDYPLLFDVNYNPKPAYRGFLAAGREN